jgi:CMP-2-keto-3-deoxyoctulosonic acid synthetase
MSERPDRPHVVGSIIARLGSKRLAYKNLLPFFGTPLVVHGIHILMQAGSVDKIVLSTESELIARQVSHLPEVTVIMRPQSLAGDGVPSVDVFRHIVELEPCDIHVNYNMNYPLCHPAVIDRAVQEAQSADNGESLSLPAAAWAQTAKALAEYQDPHTITATLFDDDRVEDIDVHTLEDLIKAHQRRDAFNQRQNIRPVMPDFTGST